MAEKAMTKTEREELKRLARERARVAKADVQRRSADLKAMFEQQMVTEYDFDRDDVWREAEQHAREAVAEAQRMVEERCNELGIPKEMAPHFKFEWIGRGPYAVKSQQQDLRRAAHKRIEAMERTAVHEIDKSALEVQTELVRAGMTSEDAVAFLERMPSVDALMPALDMKQLTSGIDNQPNEDIGF